MDRGGARRKTNRKEGHTLKSKTSSTESPFPIQDVSWAQRACAQLSERFGAIEDSLQLVKDCLPPLHHIEEECFDNERPYTVNAEVHSTIDYLLSDTLPELYRQLDRAATATRENLNFQWEEQRRRDSEYAACSSERREGITRESQEPFG
jgi:hypothetical protein